MSYKLEKPCTQKARNNFITRYSQDCFQDGYKCTIAETEDVFFETKDYTYFDFTTKIKTKDKINNILRGEK